MTISRLRKKIEAVLPGLELISTVRNNGLLVRPGREASSAHDRALAWHPASSHCRDRARRPAAAGGRGLVPAAEPRHGQAHALKAFGRSYLSVGVGFLETQARGVVESGGHGVGQGQSMAVGDREVFRGRLGSGGDGEPREVWGRSGQDFLAHNATFTACRIGLQIALSTGAGLQARGRIEMGPYG